MGEGSCRAGQLRLSVLCSLSQAVPGSEGWLHRFGFRLGTYAWVLVATPAEVRLKWNGRCLSCHGSPVQYPCHLGSSQIRNCNGSTTGQGFLQAPMQPSKFHTPLSALSPLWGAWVPTVPSERTGGWYSLQLPSWSCYGGDLGVWATSPCGLLNDSPGTETCLGGHWDM